jgi:hypothetical protein
VRCAVALGVLALAAHVSVSAAQPSRAPDGAWVVTTDREHAACLPQALPEAAMAIAEDGDRATVTIEVAARTCDHAIDRLLAYGIEEVRIGGEPVALLGLRRRCRGSAAAETRWAVSLADFQRGEQALWDRLEAAVRADTDGSVDARGASELARRCPALVAELVAPARIDSSVSARLADWRFTHGAWQGTVADLGRHWCPQVAGAAARIARRAPVWSRLSAAQRALYAMAPAGWYVPRGRAPVTDLDALLRARVWIRVDDGTLEDLVLGECPLETPVVTRYTRYTFDARGTVLARRTITACAAFDPRQLR